MPKDISESFHEACKVVRRCRKCCVECERSRLTTETVESAALSLERVDNVEGCDCLALGVLSVCDSVADDTFEEGLEDTTCLFVNHWG